MGLNDWADYFSFLLSLTMVGTFAGAVVMYARYKYGEMKRRSKAVRPVLTPVASTRAPAQEGAQAVALAANGRRRVRFG